jgi:hypothetical protein
MKQARRPAKLETKSPVEISLGDSAQVSSTPCNGRMDSRQSSGMVVPPGGLGGILEEVVCTMFRRSTSAEDWPPAAAAGRALQRIPRGRRGRAVRARGSRDADGGHEARMGYGCALEECGGGTQLRHTAAGGG